MSIEKSIVADPKCKLEPIFTLLHIFSLSTLSTTPLICFENLKTILLTNAPLDHLSNIF